MLLAIGLEQGVFAAPRVPTNPQEVLEVLPEKIFVPAVSNNAAPDLIERLTQAESLLQHAQQTGDPRYLGYAEAQLKPWLTQATIPDDVLVMRARLRQFNHQFANALIDLSQVLQHQPNHPEALLLQASIYQVRADYPQARSACQRLRSLSTLILALVCEAQVDGLNGNSDKAYAAMKRLASVVTSMDVGQQAWFYLAWGDLAVRRGQLADAERYYRQLDMMSPSALAALSDVLLLQKRYAEVQKLLANYQQHDGLLLRLAIAEKGLKTARAPALAEILKARFAALRQRADNSHLREEAMFNLYVQNDSAKALVLARANWQQQREPQDTEIYWQLAQATQSTADINILQQWLKLTGLQDVYLAQANRVAYGVAL
jgi:Tfp pilus assembly protein PilF